MTDRGDPHAGRPGRAGEGRRTLSYAGWLTFQWRSVQVEFPDFPGFHPRAAYGSAFNARIREQIAAQIATLVASGKPIPSPTPQLAPREGHQVRWFIVEVPVAGRGREPPS